MGSLTVLLVEDNPHDVRLIQRAFSKADVQHDLRVVGNGDDALAYLSGTGVEVKSSTTPRPDLILLERF